MKSCRGKMGAALSDRVYRKLYRRIVTGKLKPGQRITELQIAKSEGVSQAPVREALKRLAEDRLVDLIPRSGCYVCKLTHDEIAEIYDIRERLECLAMEYAFDKFDRKKIEGLREKFHKCLNLKGKGFTREELKLDSQLHTLIYETAGGKHLWDVLNRLHAKIEIFRTREAQASRAEIAIEHHIAILDAILTGKKNKALRLLENHIETSRKYVLSLFA
ncbi:MAG: GntR family transcriptional regulator [Planctomycetota bacterium]|nr:GntR family transcriptional regulator [Planctomycetota bacterium]